MSIRKVQIDDGFGGMICRRSIEPKTREIDRANEPEPVSDVALLATAIASHSDDVQRWKKTVSRSSPLHCMWL